ncbi:MAG: FadR/GntR family transcriptional regulator [Oscillospiraceae bacterium]
MSELSNIKSQALTERVEERLFAYILDNHLKVGAKLPNEHELAAHFEVSRGTVREAVKLLVSRGVLRVKHGSGTYVASLFPLHANPLGLDAVEDKLQLALDLTDVRLMLEPTIAALAAQNRTDEEVEQLAEYCDAVREKIEAGEDYLIEDMRFHWYLAKCSHNMVVEPLMPIIDAAVISIANITRKELLTMTIDTHRRYWTPCVTATRRPPAAPCPCISTRTASSSARRKRRDKTVAKLQFRRQVCFDFAKHGRPKVPIRKLSPSGSKKPRRMSSVFLRLRSKRF